MFVGRRMTRNLITVTPDTSILKVKNLLKQYNIDQVPVVEGKKLLGIITDKDIRENSASPASTLSVHELNYLLSEMKGAEIMTKKLYTVTPGTTIEDAVRLINEKRVNSLPVVVNGDLVGIITTCDMLNVLLEFMGIGTTSSRVELTLTIEQGQIRIIRLPSVRPLRRRGSSVQQNIG
jgi:acetoin utilization protein AcuB